MKKILLKLSHIIPDFVYLKIMYYKHFSKLPNLDKPKTFNEKLQWLKLYDRNPDYSMMVDKYEVKQYISDTLGTKYVIPTLGKWSSVDDIDFDLLPNEFVLKCNHDSKSTVICKNKSDLNIRWAKNKLESHIKSNAFWYGREWPYKNIKPCIIAEKYMVDEECGDLFDYKVLCFNGKAKLIEVHMGRHSCNYMQDFYTAEWEKTAISQGLTSSNIRIDKPVFLEEMLFLTERLAKGMRHVRIDWYYVKGQLYFGEITFFDGSGFVPFDDPKDDLLLGSWIKF